MLEALPPETTHRGTPIIDLSWGVVMVDVTDSARPDANLAESNGWLLVCYGHPRRACPLVEDPRWNPEAHGVVVEYDPNREAHHTFLDHFRQLLRPGVALRVVARGTGSACTT